MWSSSSKSPNRVWRSRIWDSNRRLRNWVVAGLFLVSLGVSSSETSQLREEAQGLLQSYFSALQTGNVALLREVLGGELGADRASLTQNPEYGLELVRSYAGSDFEVIDLQVLESGDVVATVDTWLDASESIRNRFTIRRSSASEGFRIVHSEVLP